MAFVEGDARQNDSGFAQRIAMLQIDLDLYNPFWFLSTRSTITFEEYQEPKMADALSDQ